MFDLHLLASSEDAEIKEDFRIVYAADEFEEGVVRLVRKALALFEEGGDGVLKLAEDGEISARYSLECTNFDDAVGLFLDDALDFYAGKPLQDEIGSAV